MTVTEEHIELAKNISKKYNVSKIVLFGSSLNNLLNVHDLDIAVGGLEGWKFFELAARLEEELNLNVDLILLDDNSEFGRHIKKVGKVLYEQK